MNRLNKYCWIFLLFTYFPAKASGIKPTLTEIKQSVTHSMPEIITEAYKGWLSVHGTSDTQGRMSSFSVEDHFWDKVKIHYIQLDETPDSEVILEIRDSYFCSLSGNCNGYILKIAGDKSLNLGEIFLNGSISVHDAPDEASTLSAFRSIHISWERSWGSGTDIYKYDIQKNKYTR